MKHQAKEQQRYFTHEDLLTAKENLLKVNPEVVSKFLDKRPEGEAMARFSVVFMTPKRQNVEQLLKRLEELDCWAEFSFNKKEKRYAVRGDTAPTLVSVPVANQLGERMSDLGFELDCAFFGLALLEEQEALEAGLRCKKSHLEKSRLMIKTFLDQGVSERLLLHLEYSFRADSLEKAQKLNERLDKIGYFTQKPALQDDGSYLLRGWTSRKPLFELAIREWTSLMCQLSQNHACAFEDWRTFPEQTIVLPSRKRRFHSFTIHLENKKAELATSPKTLAMLYQDGVTDQMSLPLNFHFFTNKSEKANKLIQALAALGYKWSRRRSLPFFDVEIEGWTTPMRMDEETVVAWSQRMCDLGFEHDCKLDGWGTYAPPKIPPKEE